jgi:addiction module HigA family antidote
MLYHEFMVPYELSARAVAKLLDVPANRITSLVNGDRGMTADTALRLEKVFGMSAAFWMRLQASYDESKARTEHDYSALKLSEGVNDNLAGDSAEARLAP